MPRLRLIAAILLAGVGLPAAAAADGPILSAAPGRIVLQADDGGLLERTGGTGGGIQRTTTITRATPLRDGGTLLTGTGNAFYPALYAAKIRHDGSLDPAFGTGGRGLLNPPDSPRFSETRQVLEQPDGKLLLVGSNYGDLQVRRLYADGTVDHSYGVDGVAQTPLDCGACRAALQPGGGLVVLGEGAFIALPALPDRPNDTDQPWALTRLTPAGAIDRTFGVDGVATIRTDGYTSGGDLGLTSSGAILTVGTWAASYDRASTALLTRLTPNGAPDPAFAGGTTVEIPTLTFASDIVMQDGGDAIIAGTMPGATPSDAVVRLVRYGASGSRDLTYGSGGFADLGRYDRIDQILPGANRELIVAGRLTGVSPRGLTVRVVGANGVLDPSRERVIDVPFGGGVPSVAGVAQLANPSLLQNSFGGFLARRADGSYLVAGGVSVTSTNPRGLMGRWAVAALTPSLHLDPAFGAAATPLRLSVAFPRQRARTARARRSIRVLMQASAIGLTQIRVTHGSRAIASSVTPVLSTAPASITVALTSYGDAFLRRHRNLRVVVRAAGRDLLATPATATARGRLR